MMRTWLVNLAMKFQGIPYIWGGSNPHVGFDCSGFVIWCLQVFDVLPSGDWTADMLYRRFIKVDNPQPGDLAFYGTPKKITHVMMYIGNGNVIGASGGGSECTTEEIAKSKNAMVKIKPARYRNDFVSFGTISATVGSK